MKCSVGQVSSIVLVKNLPSLRIHCLLSDWQVVILLVAYKRHSQTYRHFAKNLSSSGADEEQYMPMIFVISPQSPLRLKPCQSLVLSSASFGTDDKLVSLVCRICRLVVWISRYIWPGFLYKRFHLTLICRNLAVRWSSCLSLYFFSGV